MTSIKLSALGEAKEPHALSHHRAARPGSGRQFSRQTISAAQPKYTRMEVLS